MPIRLSILPPALAAFAAGVVLLQWQPELSSAAPWFIAFSVVASLALALTVCWPRFPFRRIVIAALVSIAAGLLGFGYATWRAQERLDDALPLEWEGVDIALVGIIDDLPQTSPRSSRFAFAVERSLTPNAVVPSRLSLAWYAQVRKDGTIDDVPHIAAGERWRLVVRLKRPHGTVNPHGFDVVLVWDPCAGTTFARDIRTK